MELFGISESAGWGNVLSKGYIFYFACQKGEKRLGCHSVISGLGITITDGDLLSLIRRMSCVDYVCLELGTMPCHWVIARWKDVGCLYLEDYE